MHTTIRQAIAQNPPGSVALRDADGVQLTYAELLAFVDDLGERLDLTPDDTIMYVMDEGAISAVAFLAIAASAKAAPISSAAPKPELLSAMLALQPRTCLTTAAHAASVGEVCSEAGVDLVVVTPTRAGLFTFELAEPEDAAAPRRPSTPRADADAVCLLLRTSGTTAAPKVVPLTSGALVANGATIGKALGLTAADVAVNTMPLFHVGGLSASLLAPMSAGGSAVCLGGFSPGRFADAISSTAANLPRPTYYSAVPTIHLSLMQHVRCLDHFEHELRLIRSGAAALPHGSALALRETFGTAVIPSYSMTEQMPISQAPADYQLDRPGTVGVGRVDEVAIFRGEERVPRPAGPTAEPSIGEVCISGPTVMQGYVGNAEADAAAFFSAPGEDGEPRRFFRTGDLGHLDADGYLYLSGRQKELIKVGGEQVSPFEVEDALLADPRVHIAIVYGIPNALLGEVTGAAVVLREGAARGAECEGVARELRELCQTAGLATHKVPRVSLVREEQLPRGPTGKYLRQQLAAALHPPLEAPPAGGGPGATIGTAAGVAVSPPSNGSDATLGIRFILSLIVCLNHIGDHAWPFEPRGEHSEFSSAITSARVVGDSGVVLFGMLSGFALVTTMGGPVSRGGYLRFVESRSVPVYLLYLIATLLCAVNRLFFCPPDRFGPYEFGSVDACRATAFGLSYGGTWGTSLLVTALTLQAWPLGLYVWHISYYTWFNSVHQFCILLYPWLDRVLRGRAARGTLCLVGTHFALQLLHFLTLVLMEAVYLSNKARSAEFVNYWVWGGYMFPPFWAIRFACGMFVGFHYITHRPDKKASAWKWGLVADGMTAMFLLNYVLMIAFRVDIRVRFSYTSLLEDRMYCGVVPRLAVPIFSLYIYALAVGRGVTCRLCSSRVLVRLSPVSYAVYLLHQPVFEWYSVASTGAWWSRRKPFEWFSPDPIPLDWWETGVVLLLVVLFAKFVTWLANAVLMSRWLALVRWATCRASSSSSELGSSAELVLSAVADLVGQPPSLHDRPADLLSSLGVAALSGAIASREPATRLTALALMQCDTVADVVAAVEAARKSRGPGGGAAAAPSLLVTLAGQIRRCYVPAKPEGLEAGKAVAPPGPNEPIEILITTSV